MFALIFFFFITLIFTWSFYDAYRLCKREKRERY